MIRWAIRRAARVRVVVPALAALAVFSMAVAQVDDAMTVRVDGVGAVVSDAGAARDEAIRDALRLAIEQALGISIQGRTVMVDLQVVEDRVVGRTEGFVRSYVIVREGREGSLYRVTIEAVVDTDLMIDDLEGFGALLRTALGNPRVLVVASSARPDRHTDLVERALVDHLVSRQFQVLSPEQLGALRDPLGERTPRELANLARTADADLVVSVAIDVDDVGSRSTAVNEVHSMRADVSLQAILAGTAQIVASARATATRARTLDAAARDDAALAALDDALTPFTLTTVGALNTTLAADGTQRSVQVVIEEVFDFAAVLALREVLVDVRGVVTLQQRQFGEGRATFDVQGSQTTDDIAVRLMAQDAVPVTVTFLDAQRVVVRVAP